MIKYIAILRGINVGGKRKILMSDLRELLTRKGFKNVATYIQSGNIAFRHQSKNSREIETIIFDAIKIEYGFDVPIIVLSPKEIEDIINNNPFKDKDESKLHITFFKDVPNTELVAKVEALNFAPDEFIFSKKAVYLNIEDKYHKSKLSTTFFEKKLKSPATTRNWKTVNKLLEIN